jgi:hypothetical protein
MKQQLDIGAMTGIDDIGCPGMCCDTVMAVALNLKGSGPGSVKSLPIVVLDNKAAPSAGSARTVDRKARANLITGREGSPAIELQ